MRRLRNVTRHAYALEFVSRVATSGLRKNARNRGNGLSLAGGFVGPPLLIGDRPVARLKPVRFCLLYVVDSTVVTTFCLPALFELSAEVARVRVELRGGDGRGHCLGGLCRRHYFPKRRVSRRKKRTHVIRRIDFPYTVSV